MRNPELKNNFEIIDQMRNDFGGDEIMSIAIKIIMQYGMDLINTEIDNIMNTIEGKENLNKMRIIYAMAAGLSQLEPEYVLAYVQEQKGKYKLY